tara:strand:+ start:1099 stop:1572 length:474 start_codon:yes stop_codon:yes gene_type:complete
MEFDHSIIDRFDEKWLEDPRTGCWEWQAFRDRGGYGKMSVGSRVMKAHRVSFALTFGPFDSDLLVCHDCDNRSCVNPDHLFLGTPADNSADMKSKGRQAKGEANGRSKLTEADIPAIMAQHATGATMRAIARDFGVSHAVISSIIRGESWTHVKREP